MPHRCAASLPARYCGAERRALRGVGIFLPQLPTRIHCPRERRETRRRRSGLRCLLRLRPLRRSHALKNSSAAPTPSNGGSASDSNLAARVGRN
jgi:hypothetical protein